MVANVLRQGEAFWSDELFAVIIDTFNDKRNGYRFQVNPNGLRMEGIVVNTTNTDMNWNGIWQAAATTNNDGWSAEMLIPFKTLSFDPNNDTWGINFERDISRGEEGIAWVSRNQTTNPSIAGIAVGFEDLQLGRGLDVVPSVVLNTQKTHASPGANNDDTAPSLDIYYKITPSLNSALTFNTDFSATEVDDRQVELTRFNLFFPEKRPFFLENAGAFTVTNSGGAAFNDPGQTELFFSRRIGIGPQGQAIPIIGGARLSGKVTDDITVGLLNMQTEEVNGLTPANNFTVARLRHDLPNRSSVGGLFVQRLATGRFAGSRNHNRTYALDGRWGFGQNGLVSGFASKTETPGRRNQDHAYDMAVDYNAQAWRVRGGFMEMGKNFNPEVGFVRRRGFKKLDGGVFYTWRPDEFFKVQEMRPHITFNRFWDIDTGFIETSLVHMDNFWEFDDSSTAITAWNVRKEGVTHEFTISGVPVLPGSYDWHELSLNYNSDNSAPGTVGFRLQKSGFFGGHLLQYGPTAGFRRGEILNARFSWTRNHIDLPMGAVVTNLMSSRVAYNFSTRVFAQGLVQYNDSVDLWSVNLRFGWLQAANTGFFVVYNDTDGLGDFVPDGSGRSLILKYSRLFDLIQ